MSDNTTNPIAPPAEPVPSVVAPAAAAAEDCGADHEAANSSSTQRKRKVCIYFGYVGERYSGLQYVKEDHINTIERELLSAVHKAGLIGTANFSSDSPMQKITWERASRTDKGVHALKNLISAKFTFDAAEVESGDYTSSLARINEHLPSDIRCYKIQPVTGSFNAYMACSGRRYQYYLPTFALCNKAQYDAFLPHDIAPQHIADNDADATCKVDFSTRDNNKNKKKAEEEGGASTTDDGKVPSGVGQKREREEEEENADAVTGGEEEQALRKENKDVKYGNEPMNVFKSIPEAHMRRLAEYRIDKDNLERARRLFNMYVGTKPYHNFTPGGKAADKSTVRFIQKITVHDPEVLMPTLPAAEDSPLSPAEREAKQQHLAARYPNGLEWVRIEIEGQSFMLNQIRKMVGNIICAMILGLPDYFVSDCLQSNVVTGIPMAPANGLFLSYLDFTLYNKRLERMKNQQGIDVAGKEGVDMDFEVNSIDEALKAKDPALYNRLVDEQARAKAEVAAMHKQILATVGRRECCEDITGRWLRSCRHVSRLAFRMTFGPDDDPSRYAKAPEPMAARTAPKTNYHAVLKAEAKAAAAAAANSPAAAVAVPSAIESTTTPAASEVQPAAAPEPTA